MQIRGVLGGLAALSWVVVGTAADATDPVLSAEQEPALRPPAFGISAERLLENTRSLASDEFEGRAPGTVGEEKTVGFLVEQFRRLGLESGVPDGGYVQPVKFVAITSRTRLTFASAEETFPLLAVNDFIGPSLREEPSVEVTDSEVVFVGCGAVVPELGWDDYKDVDVRGKTVVVLVEDPPLPEGSAARLDSKVFGPMSNDYYGRWQYKYDNASARGAAACFIVHELPEAAYTFPVLLACRGRENLELCAPDHGASRVAVEGWLKAQVATQVFAAVGGDFAAWKLAARQREFRPVVVGLKASFTVENELRPQPSRNVVALLPGSDPALRDEYVIYSAHWDHVGRDTNLSGDQIYNGAGDNALGVAVLLETARALQALPAEQRPRRSIVFLAVTAEEKGMLGSRYYARYPVFPRSRTVANLNVDGANQFGPTRDLEVIALGATTIDDVAATIARELGRELFPDSHPDRGSYFRSDHFEFAKVGVPAFHVKRGHYFHGRPDSAGARVWEEYYTHDYHRVSDEVKPGWTCEGAAHDAEFLVRLGLAIANASTRPQWTTGGPFAAQRARDAGAMNMVSRSGR